MNSPFTAHNAAIMRREAMMRAARTFAITFLVATVLTVALDGVWNDFIEYQEETDE